MEKTLNHQFHRFDSGLRLVCIPMEGTKTATVMVMVGTGSKYETKDINGISHFLEHMMFKGTTKRPNKLQIAQELQSIGAEFNAFTGKEYTGYYARASATKTDILMDVVFDIFLNSKLDAKDIDMERGVIIEEINMYQDDPPRYVWDLLEQLLYGDQPAGWDIAGEKDTINRINRQQFVDYFNSHYVASNTVVIVAGNVNPEEIKEKTGKYFEHIRQADKVSKLKTTEQQSGVQSLVHFKKTDQSHFVIGFRAYSMFDKRKYPLEVLASILGGGMSSRLFQEVRDSRGLAYYVGASTEQYTDTGFISTFAGVNNSKAEEAIRVIIEEIKKIKNDGVTDDELQRAKDQTEGSLALMLENSRAVAQSYAGPVLFEDKILTPEEELAKIKAVTREDILAVANEVFMEEKMNLTLIGPFEKDEPFKNILKI